MVGGTLSRQDPAWIQEAKDKHKTWLEKPNSGHKADFSKLDLSDLDFSESYLSRASFVGAILFRANFSNAVLDQADFFAADLSEANLDAAHLDSAIFCGARHADFRGGMLLSSDSNIKTNVTDLTECTLDYAYLARANLSGANIQNASFVGATLAGAKFCGCNLSNTNFEGADLSGANLSDTQLSGTVFADANLTGAKLDGAKLYDADFKDANLTDARIEKIELAFGMLSGETDDVVLPLLQEKISRAVSSHEIWLKTAGASGKRAEFVSQKLSGIDFSKRNLTGVRFKNSILNDTNFGSAKLKLANFSGAKLQDSYFEGADLSGAKFFGADLRFAQLTNVTIGDVEVGIDQKVAASRTMPTDFRKADLRGAVFSKIGLAQCLMTDAITDSRT